jgi:hypothetical protein
LRVVHDGAHVAARFALFSQGQFNILQNGQLKIPQLKRSNARLALLLHLGQLREHTGFVLFTLF